jgi:hypothetical protein
MESVQTIKSMFGLMIVQHNRPTSIYWVRGSGVSVHAFGWMGEYV